MVTQQNDPLRKHIDQLGDLPWDMLAQIEGKYPGKPTEEDFIELVERARNATLDEFEKRLEAVNKEKRVQYGDMVILLRVRRIIEEMRSNV